jgi:Phosphotransferase enzyme family
VFVPDIADAERMSDVIGAHARTLDLGDVTGPCRLVDAQIRHSHRPSSPRCTGWATYSVPVDRDGDVLLYVRAYPDGGSDEAWDDLVANGRTAGAFHLPDHDLIVWIFPDDPSLPALSQLVDPNRACQRLPVAAPGRLDVTVVRYQPEVSATLRYQIAAGLGQDPVVVFGKALAVDPTAMGARHDQLWRQPRPGLRIARPLGTDPGLRVLWTLGVTGEPVRVGGNTDAAAELARDLATIVAALHDSVVSPDRELRWEDYLVEGRKKAAKLGAALPRCRSAVDAIAPRDASFASGAPAALVHGDLHLDQFVDSPGGPVLVDLDSVAAGDAELDLAELVVDVGTRDLPEPTIGAFVDALLDGYTRHAPARPIRLGLLGALADAEFLTRCHRHLRRRAPGWERALEQALAQHEVLRAVLPTSG